MKKYIQILEHTRLFRGINREEIFAVLKCLDARLSSYQKGELVIRQGEHISDIAVLVYGKLHIQKDDYWGNCNIVNTIKVGEMFAEAYAFPDSGAVMNNVSAVEKSEVIFFNSERIITACSDACGFHSTVMRNFISSISEKNRKLVRKIEHISQRTIREKLMSYLSEQSELQNSSDFKIPFNRQQLADFLSADRSAVSNELCKMRDEGLLKFEKNKFSLIG